MWKYLIKKEFKQFLRDPGMPRMTMMFPLIIVLVFPFAANMEIKNVDLVIVDSDRSTQSGLLIEKCSSSGWFRIVDICDSPDAAQKLMDKGRTDAILTIDRGFGDMVDLGTAGIDGIPVGIKVNTVNGTRGSIGAQYLRACVSGFVAASSGGAGLPGSGGDLSSDAAAARASGSIETIESYRYNPFMDYKMFMIPALIVIAITMMCGFMPALNIVSEKEKGTIEQINVTPVRKTTFIICKMVPYIVIAYFLMFSCLLLAWLVFGYSCKGSLLDICIFTFAHIVIMASFGLLISNYSDNVQQAMFVIWFFSMIFMLMSGIFTPISSMPEWAQTITYANPLRYFADAMRGIFLKGSGIADLLHDLLALAGIGTLTTTWAILSYRKTT